MNPEAIEWELHPFFVGDVLLSRNIWKSQYGSTVFENVTDKALFMVNTYSHLGEVDFRFGYAAILHSRILTIFKVYKEA